jgi:hypothetical protein
MASGIGVDTLINAGSTLIAAYAGARLAFGFNLEQEGKKVRKAEVEECNRALLTAQRQLELLLSYRNQVLEELRDSPARHFLVIPSPEVDASYLHVNGAALAFLIGTPAEAVPARLAFADDTVRAFILASNIRAKFHQEFQREVSSIDLRQELPYQDVEHHVGPRLTESLRRATDDLYDLNDDGIEALTGIGAEVPPLLKGVYKDAVFAGFAAPTK